MFTYVILSLFFLLGIIACVIYYRLNANKRLDRMVLLNLLNEEEKKYFIHEYKKIKTAKLIYDLISEDRLEIEIAHEVIKERRDK